MVFSSLEFLFCFFPLVLLGYALIKKKFLNAFLLTASLAFYYAGAKEYFVLLLAMIFISYIYGIIIGKQKYKVLKKVALSFGIITVLIILITYKYTPFFSSIINSIFNTNIDIEDTTIPLGLSFYTFQIISYMVDVYKGEKALRNILDLGLYVSFFPQLIAGPIIRFNDFKKYLSQKYRAFDFDNLSLGLWRFSIGLCKKVILANNLGVLARIVFDFKPSGNMTFMYAWLGAIGYALQIYYDFSGYSDMAIGLGTMFGFKFKENFNYPYSATSIKDFWRRWNISLSTFFRDYVYIPLGGNKCKKYRHVINLIIVWFLTGLWHGANYTFVIWGLLYGLFMIIENAIHFPDNKIINFIHRIVTLIIVIFLWVIFRCNDIKYAAKYMLCMVGVGTGGFMGYTFRFQLSNFLPLLIISIIFAFPVVPYIKKRYGDTKTYKIISTILLVIGLIVSISHIFMNGYNPFIYFNF